jgi:hypothetical protein
VKVSLVLVNRFGKSYEEGSAVVLKIRSTTKRQILAVIRIQSGLVLFAILNLPSPREKRRSTELLRMRKATRQPGRGGKRAAQSGKLG